MAVHPERLFTTKDTKTTKDFILAWDLGASMWYGVGMMPNTILHLRELRGEAFDFLYRG